ncbi:hypothetical protein TELCIR_14058 [Teladorsagia circumcincta]|uniref:Uncharacterized protein n=1 Tax=Teladorsagia circumcincta TaxID=45464 RepID=A0A2G9U235_TELCI|nr:hypothetical protein TELCIR_14058 [Teladorsagia circumcincta]
MRERRLQWYGHAMRAAPNTVAATVYRFEVDLKIAQLRHKDVLNRMARFDGPRSAEQRQEEDEEDLGEQLEL